MTLDVRSITKSILEEVKEAQNVSNEKPSITEKVENNIYFYSNVGSSSILTFNKDMLNLKNDLIYRSIVTKHTVAPIRLYIQSYGGSLLAGLSAMDTILEIKKEVPVYTIIDGYVASAGSLMSIAGTKRFVKKNSYILIHQLSGFTWGNYEQLKDDMQNNEKFMNTLKKIYLEFTKLPEEKINETLKHDWWLTAEEAIEYGLADEIL